MAVHVLDAFLGFDLANGDHAVVLSQGPRTVMGYLCSASSWAA